MKRIVLMLTATSLVATGCARTGGDPGEAEASNLEPKAVAGDNASGPKAQTACELLTGEEIAGFLKVPQVKKDELNSGMNPMIKVDICNWYVREGTSDGVEIRLRRAEADEGSESLAFSAARGDAVEHDAKRDQEAQPLTGVGDQAFYSPYPVGAGGSIAMRAGRSAVTITGSPPKDTLISMAKLIARRL
jgi:hypothetical protein